MPDDRTRSRPPCATAPRRHPLVVTTGGTGLTPRDVTPQATARRHRLRGPRARRGDARDGPGRSTPLADLSRGVVGVRGRTLIVNLPGSPKGALESLEAIVPVLDHALETLAGPFDHAIAPERRLTRRCSSRSRDVPAYPLVFPVFWGAAAFFVLAMARHLRVFARRAGRSEPVRRRPGPRSSASSSTRSSRRRCSRTRGPALMHAGIFWGFVLLTIGTANIVTGGLIQAVLSIPFDGLLWTLDQRDAERRRGHRPGRRSAGRSSAGSSRSRSG